jgi:hypothetical protein
MSNTDHRLATLFVVEDDDDLHEQGLGVSV